MLDKKIMKKRSVKNRLFILLFVWIAIPCSAQMEEAYKLANEMVREKLARENQDNIRILDDLKMNDVIVVDGSYDHIHVVLESLKIPFARIDHGDLVNARFEPHQTVFVNCSASFPKGIARKLATFVAQGGLLITTDWALTHVIEEAFPNTIAYNKRPTGDEVVRIEVVDKKDSLMTGFLDEKAAPVWWLEGSSYPIKVLDKQKVKVLIRSKELKEKYGEEAVVVSFDHGKGTVYHMISHFYLQRTETRDTRQNLAASEYFKDKGASKQKIEQAATTNVTYGQIQSANTSADFVSRMVIKQKKKVKK
jgi:hypothetical protein